MPPKPRARTYTAASISDSASDSVATADDDDYRQKRDRNNIAVKKSREKSRRRARETAEKMERLRRENEQLEQRTVELAAELRTLKDLLLARASSSAARRGTTKSEQPSSSSSQLSFDSSSHVPVTLADPRTVDIDHKYTTNNWFCFSCSGFLVMLWFVGILQCWIKMWASAVYNTSTGPVVSEKKPS